MQFNVNNKNYLETAGIHENVKINAIYIKNVKRNDIEYPQIEIEFVRLPTSAQERPLYFTWNTVNLMFGDVESIYTVLATNAEGQFTYSKVNKNNSGVYYPADSIGKLLYTVFRHLNPSDKEDKAYEIITSAKDVDDLVSKLSSFISAKENENKRVRLKLVWNYWNEYQGKVERRAVIDHKSKCFIDFPKGNLMQPYDEKREWTGDQSKFDRFWNPSSSSESFIPGTTGAYTPPSAEDLPFG